jgi:hypothetical protein
MSTNVAVLATCLEKVLSKTRPYMPAPPSLASTSYCPMDTLSASHLPVHATHFMPRDSRVCITVLASFRFWGFFGFPSLAVLLPAAWSLGSEGSVGCEGDGGGRGVAGCVWPEDVDVEGGGALDTLLPGCLKMPKLRDFLCGCKLHEMVFPGFTCIQRTRYDWKSQLGWRIHN